MSTTPTNEDIRTAILKLIQKDAAEIARRQAKAPPSWAASWATIERASEGAATH